MMKTIRRITPAPRRHWVGDGFPVRSLVSYAEDAAAVSPFLLLDYAGPHNFAPAEAPRGVGAHPHAGFETVTIVYDGEVAHRDSAGGGGTIGPGDVQWMTAGAGIVHEELHSPAFTKTGGPFRMVQLWVNLPAKDKRAAPGYQSIRSDQIPLVELPDGAGRVRVIAGSHDGTAGPARTFTAMTIRDIRLATDAELRLDLPLGHTAMLVVLSGHVTVNGSEGAGQAEVVHLSRDGTTVDLRADGESTLLALTGEPIGEPVVGHGPFVLESEAALNAAFNDYRSGRFGRLAI
jgi:redox-sensitive bicupin YhaK (pirin superfamily)